MGFTFQKSDGSQIKFNVSISNCHEVKFNNLIYSATGFSNGRREVDWGDGVISEFDMCCLKVINTSRLN